MQQEKGIQEIAVLVAGRTSMMRSGYELSHTTRGPYAIV